MQLNNPDSDEAGGLGYRIFMKTLNPKCTTPSRGK